ncbi:MAG TPA: SdrD B-like domain-containing protein [Anaerolineae bacterium]|nr:SdrD B-like domain-containing protein [Anaerolineae bacterium]
MKPQSRVLIVVAAFALLAGLGVLPAPPAYADTFDLRGSCPGGVGDVPALVAAINAANANGVADTILLADGCVYILAVPDNTLNGLPVITSDITIDGGVGATIQRDPAAVDYFRIFEVYTGGALTLDAITVQNGDLTGLSWEIGGGIYNSDGIVTLYASSLRNNHASEGGGIYSAGQLFVTLSTVADNTAFWGAGIINQNEMQLIDTTVSGNIADFEGGGIRHFGTGSIARSTIVSNRALDPQGGTGGGITVWGGELQISNSTLSNNQALFGGAIHLLGIEVNTTLTVTHTTVTSNTSGLVAGGMALTRGGAWPILHPAAIDQGSAPQQVVTSISVASAIMAANGSQDCFLQPGTDYTSVGYNLVGATCPATGPGDQMTTDPWLGPLADNGGPTWTHLPLDGSPAIDAGPVGACLLPIDQRGVDRPQDGNLDGIADCDAGAVEVQQQLDCGDAPDPAYPTLLASNGACHVFSPNAPGTLGALVDLEVDGQPSAAADGDDLSGEDDEDGVTFASALAPGGTAAVDVIVSADGYLNAWLDFNADGDWADAGEQIFSDLAVAAGTNALNFAVPAGAVPGTTYARFRYTAEDPLTELSYDGLWWNGEVEDYQVTIQPLLSLGDLVWYDADADGIQDVGEPGVADIVVDLYADTCAGQLLASDTTDAAGNYLFTDLAEGVYCLQLSSIPAGWTISPQDQGADDAVDSDADPATAQIAGINLAADDLDEDVGLYTTGSIGDRVFCDANGNGAYDAGEGVPAVGLTLYDDPGCDGVAVSQLSTIDSGVDGLYLFDGLAIGLAGTLPECYVVEVDETDVDLGDCNNPVTPLSYAVSLDTGVPDDLDNDFGLSQLLTLGDLVWYDSDGDGIQDPAEAGVAGIGVDLYARVCTGEALASETTDAAGNYLFTNLDEGVYCLRFSNIPAGWAISPQDQGADDTLDSDADPATAQIPGIDLAASDLDQDVGLYTTGSIGDRVFCDANSNGAYDAAEGVTAAGVTLYDDPGCDGIAGTQLSTIDSGLDGLYLFEDLAVGLAGSLPRCYVVEVDAADPDLGDCDNPVTPLSYAVSLDSGAPDDLDNDFGFGQLLTLGDLVWEDLDEDGIQDAGEPGVEGVVATLYGTADCSGAESLASEPTGADGSYRFLDLSPGTYCIAFSNLPAGWIITPQDQGTDDTLDSDADPATGRISNINLTGSDVDEDLGIHAQSTPTPTPTPPPAAPPVVPEPSTFVLMGGALAGLAGYAGAQIRARRRK